MAEPRAGPDVSHRDLRRTAGKNRDADTRMVKNKAVSVALGVARDGQREGLGLWIAENEQILAVGDERTENRGVDILIALVDGPKAPRPSPLRSRYKGPDLHRASGAPLPDLAPGRTARP